MITTELIVAQQKIADRENLDGKFVAQPGRIFLNGDAIDCGRWATLVRDLHDADVNPNLVVVLSSFPGMEWIETHSLRAEVVTAGGILDWMDNGQFSSAVGRWQECLRPVLVNQLSAPPTPDLNTASWDTYRDSYLSEEDFKALSAHLTDNGDEAGKNSAIS